MSAFIIVDTKIANDLEYEEYKKLAKPIVEKFGGIYRVRGGKMETRESDLWTPTRMVVIEFPDLARARAFLDSDEYAPVRQLRHKHAECTLFIVDGS